MGGVRRVRVGEGSGGGGEGGDGKRERGTEMEKKCDMELEMGCGYCPARLPAGARIRVVSTVSDGEVLIVT